MSPRWFIRGLLGLLPPRARGKFRSHPREILYLFWGTYGDFVQALGALAYLASRYPTARIHLFAPIGIVRDFSGHLPPKTRRVGPVGLTGFFLHPADWLFTNAVGVYRVRFEFLARFAAGASFGFCYRHESGRRGYTACLRLGESNRDFAALNCQVLRLAARPGRAAWVEARDFPIDVDSCQGAPGRHFIPATGGGLQRPGPWHGRSVLFHVGSAGFLRDVGEAVYRRLIRDILEFLDRRKIPLRCIAGPRDNSAVLWAKEALGGLAPHIFAIGELEAVLRTPQQLPLCFDSFLAHYCRYLAIPAVVLHRHRVPNGYDCSPLHHQVVLGPGNGWDLHELFALFDPA